MATYTAKDITVLEGLEPVRRRPGMYIGGVGSTGLHHLVWEILDNAVDEAMNGHASNMRHAAQGRSSITVQDDGRGIPVDKHPQTKTSALEVIFTTLHAGGKFEGQNYKTAGGLHGVGASVVNALSKRAGRDRAPRRRDLGAALQAGRAAGRRQENRPGARHRHDHLLPSRHADFSEDRVRRRDHSRASRGRELPAQGPQDPRSRTKRRRRGSRSARRSSTTRASATT